MYLKFSNKYYRHTIGTKAGRTLIWCATGLCALLTGCKDDTFDDYNQKHSGPLRFEISAPTAWSQINTRSANGHRDISITTTESDTENPLYLIEEVSELPDSIITRKESSRGKPVESPDFHTSIGMTAIAYSGTWNNGTPESRPAHNIKLQGGNNSIWAPPADNPLNWADYKSQKIRFCAYAPHSDEFTNDAEKGTLTHSTNDDGWNPTIDYTVATDIKKQVDLLACNIDCDAADGGLINLHFKHALTAVTIKTAESMPAATIDKITISGVKGNGTYQLATGTWTPAGGDCEYSITDEITIGSTSEDGSTVTDPTAGTNIAGNKTADGWDGLTLFMIPQELTADAKLKISFTETASELHRTLVATIGGEGKKWEAGRLYSYSVSASDIVATPVIKFYKPGTSDFALANNENIPFSGVISADFAAYVEITSANEPTHYAKVPYTIYSSTDDGNTWEKSELKPYDSSAEPEDITKAQNLYINLAAQPVFTQMHNRFNGASAITETKDLSETESANCYMINAPGNYKFRTVYGNSLKNGSENPSAYTVNPILPDDAPEGTTIHKGMKYYPDHNNNKIKTPYIKEQIKPEILKDAFILWQDSPGLIDHVELDTDGDYISFHVSEHTIAPGNAVIALRNTDDVIVWSWHIWVTTETWTDLITTQGQDSKTYKLPKTVLGYSPAHEGNSSRQIKMKIDFDLSKYRLGTKTITQIDGKDLSFIQDEIKASVAGDNTYYQWGRKDAMVPGIYDNITNNTYFGANYKKDSDGSPNTGELTMENKPIFNVNEKYKFKASPKEYHGLNYGYVISHPNEFIMSHETSNQPGVIDYRRHWHNHLNPTKADYFEEGTMYQVWNSTAYSEGNFKKDLSGVNSIPVTKTVFDPSPAGFHVPPISAFSAFAGNANGYGRTNPYNNNIINWNNSERCWIITNGKITADNPWTEVKLYSTGVRDMNFKSSTKKFTGIGEDSTFPAFSMLCYISSATLNEESDKFHQVLILYFDKRYNQNADCESDKPVNYAKDDPGAYRCGTDSQNSYGMTVWPMKD
ncbi:MAG: fimbrillin family protein [Muribaculaceae bacterium]|nr:fimbrillin family protein [Muribaculaceae bacterium]